MNDSHLVYSTETGRICPECGKPVSACSCKKENIVSPLPDLLHQPKRALWIALFK